jgi:hypothetical protein
MLVETFSVHTTVMVDDILKLKILKGFKKQVACKTVN